MPFNPDISVAWSRERERLARKAREKAAQDARARRAKTDATQSIIDAARKKRADKASEVSRKAAATVRARKKK